MQNCLKNQINQRSVIKIKIFRICQIILDNLSEVWRTDHSSTKNKTIWFSSCPAEGDEKQGWRMNCKNSFKNTVTLYMACTANTSPSVHVPGYISSLQAQLFSLSLTPTWKAVCTSVERSQSVSLTFTAGHSRRVAHTNKRVRSGHDTILWISSNCLFFFL